MATEYVVLENAGGEDGVGWHPIGSQEARSASSAIRQHLAKLTEGRDLSVLPHGSPWYVAVPARSWKPVKVTVETKTALKFS